MNGTIDTIVFQSPKFFHHFHTREPLNIPFCWLVMVRNYTSWLCGCSASPTITHMRETPFWDSILGFAQFAHLQPTEKIERKKNKNDGFAKYWINGKNVHQFTFSNRMATSIKSTSCRWFTSPLATINHHEPLLTNHQPPFIVVNSGSWTIN